MLLKDAQIGKTYMVENIPLPFQLERRLEALGMIMEITVYVLGRKEMEISIVKFREPFFFLEYNITKNIEVKEGKTNQRA